MKVAALNGQGSDLNNSLHFDSLVAQRKRDSESLLWNSCMQTLRACWVWPRLVSQYVTSVSWSLWKCTVLSGLHL